MKVNTLSKTGTKGTATASDALMGVETNWQLLSQAIRVYLSNQRQGTSRVKTRGEINRTKKKWYRQKGTGNARHGARSAPIFVGGGVAHGPKGIENWSRDLSPRMKRQALAVAMSMQAKNVVVIDSLLDLTSGKTKDVFQLLKPVLANAKKILIILPEINPVLERSLRNLPTVMLSRVEQVTALDVVTAQSVVVTSATLAALEKRVDTKVGRVVKVKKTVVAAEKEAPAAVAQPAAKPAAKPKVVKKAATTAKKTVKAEKKVVVVKKTVKKSASVVKKTTKSTK